MKLAEYLKVEGQRVKVIERGPRVRSSFWPKLLALTPWLELEFERDTSLESRCVELFGEHNHGRMRFVGDVEDQQILSLVETLRALACGRPQWDADDTPTLVGELERGVDLDVYVSQLCPYCVKVSAAALRFATIAARVSVRILRADICGLPEQVHTLPTVLADGEIVAQGAASEQTLIRQIATYQRAISPSSGVNLRSTMPVAKAPRANQRRRRSTAA